MVPPAVALERFAPFVPERPASTLLPEFRCWLRSSLVTAYGLPRLHRANQQIAQSITFRAGANSVDLDELSLLHSREELGIAVEKECPIHGCVKPHGRGDAVFIDLPDAPPSCHLFELAQPVRLHHVCHRTSDVRSVRVPEIVPAGGLVAACEAAAEIEVPGRWYSENRNTAPQSRYSFEPMPMPQCATCTARPGAMRLLSISSATLIGATIRTASPSTVFSRTVSPTQPRYCRISGTEAFRHDTPPNWPGC